MQNKRSNTGKSSNQDSNKDAADKPRQQKNKPAEQDDPTLAQDDSSSAQDDPDRPDQDALIPSQADLQAKESVEYFTPSGELPDPEAAGEAEPDDEDINPEEIK